MDTELEKIERRLMRLLQFKEIITLESLESLVPMQAALAAKVIDMEKGFADLLAIVSV